MTIEYTGKKTINGVKCITWSSQLFCSGYIKTGNVVQSEHYNCGLSKDNRSGYHYYNVIDQFAPEKQLFHMTADGRCKKLSICGVDGRVLLTPAATGFSDLAKRFKWRKPE